MYIYIYMYIYIQVNVYGYIHMYIHVSCILYYMHNVEYLFLCCTPAVLSHPGRKDEIKSEESTLLLCI